jgi:hypothetical protein
MCRPWGNYFRKVLLSMIEYARLAGRQIFLRERVDGRLEQ